MSEFFVGQKVVCVDDGPRFSLFPIWERPVRRGAEYTIRWSGNMADGEMVLLDEIRRPFDVEMRASRFRPVEYKAMSIFRAIAQGVTNRKPIVPDDYRIPGTEIPITEELIRSLFGNGRSML